MRNCPVPKGPLAMQYWKETKKNLTSTRDGFVLELAEQQYEASNIRAPKRLFS